MQTAMQISLGGIGAIVGTVSYRTQDAPRFIPGQIPSKNLFSGLTFLRSCDDSCFSRSPPFGSPCHHCPFLPGKQAHEIGRKETTS